MAAGDSAAREAARQRDLADELARRAGIATEMARNFDAAARSENRLAQTLIELEPLGYTLLTDRRWPGSKFANVDLILIGPGGVIIVDAKSWRDVSHLATVTCTAAPTTSPTRSRSSPTSSTRPSARWPRSASPPARCARSPRSPTRASCAPTSTASPCSARPRRSPRSPGSAPGSPSSRSRRCAAPSTRCSRRCRATRPRSTPARARRSPLARSRAPASRTPWPIDGGEPERLTSEQIRTALAEGLRRAPIEDWMAFLHPEQARIVRRTFTGPGRIRGAAGTGKTVVALHRAAHIARTTGGRVLVTTYVRTLPKVMEALMERLAPDVAGPHRLPQRARLRLRRAHQPPRPDRDRGGDRRPAVQGPVGPRRQGLARSAGSTRRPATGRTRSATCSRAAG